MDKRETWTPVEARRVLAALRASGMTVERFAQSRRLVPQRIYWWKKRLGDWSGGRSKRKQESATRFVPAIVRGRLDDEPGSPRVTVRIPGGVMLEVEDVGGVPAEWLSAVMRGLAIGA